MGTSVLVAEPVVCPTWGAFNDHVDMAVDAIDFHCRELGLVPPERLWCDDFFTEKSAKIVLRFGGYCFAVYGEAPHAR